MTPPAATARPASCPGSRRSAGASRSSPYGENRYWVAVLGLALYAALVAAAFALLDRRDLGVRGAAEPSRARPQPHPHRRRPDPAAGPRHARRLGRGVRRARRRPRVHRRQRRDVRRLPQVADMLRAMGGDAGSITDIYFSTELHFAAVGAAALAIALVTRMHTEETTTRARGPPRDAGAAHRSGRSGTSALAVLASAAVMLVSAVVAGLVHGADTGDVGGTVGRLVGAALVDPARRVGGPGRRRPALRRAAPLHRTGLGRAHRLPPARRVRRPARPAGVARRPLAVHAPAGAAGRHARVAPLVGLTVVAAALGGAGVAALGRRDIG